MRGRRVLGRAVGGLLGLGALYGAALGLHARPTRGLHEPPSPPALAAAAPSSAQDRVFPLTAAPASVLLLDGRSVAVWAYNDQVPGPTLRVRLGDTVVVPFTNRLPQDTTIHWHGVRLPNAMDGVPGVTQPPVHPGGTFTYRFTPKDAGTFWYHPHAHSSEQLGRGLHGVLVVEEAVSLPYTQDIVWVLDDWRVDRNGVVDPSFDSKHDIVHDGRWGNVITVNGRTDETLSVHTGERIRLRLVNTANGRVLAPDFAGLDAKIIAVDGNDTDAPMVAYPFELAPGNRVDLDITIRPDQRGQHVEVVDRYGARHRHPDAPPRTLATIVVLDGVVATPTFLAPSGPPPKLPINAATAGLNVTYSLRLMGGMGMNMSGEMGRSGGMGMRGGMGRRNGMGMGIDHGEAAGGGPKWLINGHAFPDFEPTELIDGVWTKLRFENQSGRNHPMHLHGQFFRVVARDGAAAIEPFWRDTVLVHPRETVDVVLRPVDDGAWMLHCHVLEHAEAGMMTVVNIAPGGGAVAP